MRTHRVYSGGFVVLPNAAVNDPRLSFRARGLLAYMLARPPGWRYNAERLARETTEGRDAVSVALRELARLGYYRATRIRQPSGTFLMVTEVAATPDLLPPPDTGYQGPVNQRPVNRLPVKQRPMSLPENHQRESGVEEVGK